MTEPGRAGRRPAAVLFDRDGTLVRDVPYNGDPARVQPVAGARIALDRLRLAGIPVAVVSNQSGVARGLITRDQVDAVNRRVEELLGPFAAWAICDHGPEDGCACRKPAPGLVTQVADRLGVHPTDCALVGDIGSDVDAALAAGARPILVPTPATRAEEVAAAAEVAADLIEAVDRLLQPWGGPHVLVARLDSLGDVLLGGPAVRAVAARAGQVTFLCGPRGRGAAELLPGVDRVIEFSAGWIDPEPEPVSGTAVQTLVDEVAALEVDQAIILTSFHQSPLPLALLLRLAGVPTLAAISEDYPGSLLDVRHKVEDDIHEVERALSLVATLGYRLPPGDDGRLAVRRPVKGRSLAVQPDQPYVVVHPGASVPARAWAPERHRDLVSELVQMCPVVVTGSPSERELTGFVAGGAKGSGRAESAIDAGGQLSFPELAEVLAGAEVVVTGNTGPAHLAAAVGTPVVSLFAPTVPPVRWRPWGVPLRLLGDAAIPCAGCRARTCPVEGHPCLGRVSVSEALLAVLELGGDNLRPPPAPAPVAQEALV
ncbi:MAG: HAD-IIIA family hydrolase [Actinomycetota bacterium]|nr:HAD-IIIA family hydrolase [Actinomycetota bacterium]